MKLRGQFLKGRHSDLPTMIWLADLLEPSENFTKFFTRPDNKVLDVRNVWLLNYRNFGDSDHHESFALDVSLQTQFNNIASIIEVYNILIKFDVQDTSNDIVRFMDENKITMATIGGHGFGAKVATATASNHTNRFTGVVCLDGGPLNHQYYEAY